MFFFALRCEGMAVVCGRAAGEIPRDSISTFGADIMTRLPMASISFENIFKFIYLNLNKIRTDVGRTTKTPQLSFGKNRLSRWVTRAVEPSVHFM